MNNKSEFNQKHIQMQLLHKNKLEQNEIKGKIAMKIIYIKVVNSNVWYEE